MILYEHPLWSAAPWWATHLLTRVGTRRSYCFVRHDADNHYLGSPPGSDIQVSFYAEGPGAWEVLEQRGVLPAHLRGEEGLRSLLAECRTSLGTLMGERLTRDIDAVLAAPAGGRP